MKPQVLYNKREGLSKMERKESLERLNEIKRVVDSNTLEELIEAYPDAAGFSLCKESTFISIVGISSFLVNKLIKDIENGKVH